ncbi:MAG: hypothetical protein L3K03_08615, partial [Thermoplasmata archaeon]|nr:hypothetical protein [Thermoplasmata archaeon]
MTTESERRRLPTRSARWGAIALVAVMVLSGLAALGTASATPSATTAELGPVVPDVSPSISHPLPQAAPLAGANPQGETPLPTDFLATHVNLLRPMPARETPSASETSPNLPASPDASPPSPTPFGAAVATATITGRVLNSSAPYAPISGATVVIDPIGVDCTGLASGCPSTTTDALGNYSIAGVAPGNLQIEVTAGWFVNNYSTEYGVPIGPFDAGTIHLVPDAVVSGCVLGAADHRPAHDVAISGWTRDLSVEALPTTFASSSTGCFNTPGVAVPPGPGLLEFSPSAGIYESNDTFVDLSPGEHYTLPYTVYLTEGVRVLAEPYDSVTGAPIPTGGLVAFSLQGTRSGVAFAQGTAVDSGVECSATATRGCPTAFGAPGSDTIRTYADGFTLNTSTEYVPALSPGQTFNAGKVWLVPDGAIQVTVGFTWGAAVQKAPGYAPLIDACKPTNPAISGCFQVNSCSLDGYFSSFEVTSPFGGTNFSASTCVTTCAYLNTPTPTLSNPLRNSVQIFPDTAGNCNNFAPGTPTWPIPDVVPVVDNFTWANVTPGYEMNLG